MSRIIGVVCKEGNKTWIVPQIRARDKEMWRKKDLGGIFARQTEWAKAMNQVFGHSQGTVSVDELGWGGGAVGGAHVDERRLIL